MQKHEQIKLRSKSAALFKMYQIFETNFDA